MATRAWFKGVPTALDVEALEKEFGVPTEGQIIPYESIRQVLHNPGESRLRTVLHAWRSKLYHEQNVVMGAVPGEGLKALAPGERVTLGGKKVQYAVRGIGRSARLLTVTPTERLTPTERQAREHGLTLASRILTEVQAQRLRFRGPSLPKALTK
jgi:hypothetical protein